MSSRLKKILLVNKKGLHMKTKINFEILLIILSISMIGCSITREPIRYREEFFRPVTVIPQRNNSSLTSSDMSQLKSMLDMATSSAMTLRDSLSSLQTYTGSLLASTRSLMDKVSDLESKEFLTDARQKDLEQSVAQLQVENKQLAQQLNEIREKMVAGSLQTGPVVFSPARASTTLRDEYSEGLALFQHKQYDDAQSVFSQLIDKGIEEDLSDNCEYWKGECCFAKREFNPAINSFQKVLEIESSNKKEDAYFMLGKAYEKIGDLVKARWAYEELNLLYPNNVHARVAKSKLNSLQRNIPDPQPKTNKKSTV
jgi:TolA-binding protein